MAKKIKFESSDSLSFEMIYEAFHIFSRPQGREEVRSTERILDELERISDIVKDENGAEKVLPGFPEGEPFSPRKRKLIEIGGACIFEEHDYSFLLKAIDKISLPPCRNHHMLDLFKLLDGVKSGSVANLQES